MTRHEEILTLDLLDRFAQAGCQCKTKDPLVIAKYGAAFTSREWYAVCYHPRVHSFFGVIRNLETNRADWAWFRLEELESMRARSAGRDVEIWQPPDGWKRGDPLPSMLVYPLRLERDPDWQPVPASEAGLSLT